MKSRAIQKPKKKKHALAKGLEQDIASEQTKKEKLPKPLKLRGGFVPTTKEIDAAITEGLRY
jgi:hypothetical protein